MTNRPEALTSDLAETLLSRIESLEGFLKELAAGIARQSYLFHTFYSDIAGRGSEVEFGPSGDLLFRLRAGMARPFPYKLHARDDAWEYLVARSHPWRKQLYIKGRNLTAGQLVATARANDLTEEAVADDLDLPLKAVQEAFAYAAKYKDLLDSEAAWERHLTTLAGGQARATRPVS